MGRGAATRLGAWSGGVEMKKVYNAEDWSVGRVGSAVVRGKMVNVRGTAHPRGISV